MSVKTENASHWKRKLVLEHLAQAEAHVVTGERLVARQRALIAHLDGHDLTQAKALLRQFEEIQALHIADRDRIRRELDGEG